MDASDLGRPSHRRGQGLHGPQQGSAPPQVAGHVAAAAASVFVLTLYTVSAHRDGSDSKLQLYLL